MKDKINIFFGSNMNKQDPEHAGVEANDVGSSRKSGRNEIRKEERRTKLSGRLPDSS